MRNLTLSPDSGYGGGKVKSKAVFPWRRSGKEGFSLSLFRKVLEGVAGACVADSLSLCPRTFVLLLQMAAVSPDLR